MPCTSIGEAAFCHSLSSEAGIGGLQASTRALLQDWDKLLLFPLSLCSGTVWAKTGLASPK